MPGCRSSRYLEVHHIVARSNGGGHELENLTLLCDGHHHALHEGNLTITGKAPAIVVRWTRHGARLNAPVGITPVGVTHVGATHAADAIQALVQLRFNKPVARDAVAVAIERLGPSATLEQVVREALRSAGSMITRADPRT